MRPGGGKQKGANFEREICKQLSLWLTDGKREDCLWRTAMSGGRATLAKGKVRQAGDICAVADEGWDFSKQWFVEIKHVKKLALDQFLVKGTGLLATFWQKAKHEATKLGREPMIIARQNGWPTIVLTRPGKMPWWVPPIITADEVVVSSFKVWMKNSRTPTPKRIPR